jgi:hypothetical protein
MRVDSEREKEMVQFKDKLFLRLDSKDYSFSSLTSKEGREELG